MSKAMVAGSSGLSAHACWVAGVGVEVIGFLTKIHSSESGIANKLIGDD